MAPTRRDFVTTAAAFGAAAVINPSKLPALMVNESPEITAFKEAQTRLLKKYGLAERSRYVKLERLKLDAHVLEAGAGEPVLMLHGGGGYAAGLAPMMDLLKTDFHLIVPDRPGCGLSEMINYNGVPFREHAVNFVADILDRYNLKTVSLVGNSMGGYWALMFALACPDRVSKLILIGEPAGSSPRGTVPLAPPADKNPSLEGIKKLFEFLLVADIRHVPIEVLQADLAASRIPGAAVAWDTMVDQFRQDSNLGTYGLRPELRGLKPSTLFIWGDKDRFGPPKLGQEMAAMIRNARCEVVPDAGHLLWLDQLERCASLTKEYLKTNR